jgi:hypothetical protein
MLALNIIYLRQQVIYAILHTGQLIVRL